MTHAPDGAALLSRGRIKKALESEDYYLDDNTTVQILQVNNVSDKYYLQVSDGEWCTYFGAASSVVADIESDKVKIGQLCVLERIERGALCPNIASITPMMLRTGKIGDPKEFNTKAFREFAASVDALAHTPKKKKKRVTASPPMTPRDSPPVNVQDPVTPPVQTPRSMSTPKSRGRSPANKKSIATKRARSGSTGGRNAIPLSSIPTTVSALRKPARASSLGTKARLPVTRKKSPNHLAPPDPQLSLPMPLPEAAPGCLVNPGKWKLPSSNESWNLAFCAESERSSSGETEQNFTSSQASLQSTINVASPGKPGPKHSPITMHLPSQDDPELAKEPEETKKKTLEDLRKERHQMKEQERTQKLDQHQQLLQLQQQSQASKLKAMQREQQQQQQEQEAKLRQQQREQEIQLAERQKQVTEQQLQSEQKIREKELELQAKQRQQEEELAEQRRIVAEQQRDLATQQEEKERLLRRESEAQLEIQKKVDLGKKEFEMLQQQRLQEEQRLAEQEQAMVQQQQELNKQLQEQEYLLESKRRARQQQEDFLARQKSEQDETLRKQEQKLQILQQEKEEELTRQQKALIRQQKEQEQELTEQKERLKREQQELVEQQRREQEQELQQRQRELERQREKQEQELDEQRERMKREQQTLIEEQRQEQERELEQLKKEQEVKMLQQKNEQEMLLAKQREQLLEEKQLRMQQEEELAGQEEVIRKRKAQLKEQQEEYERRQREQDGVEGKILEQEEQLRRQARQQEDEQKKLEEEQARRVAELTQLQEKLLTEHKTKEKQLFEKILKEEAVVEAEQRQVIVDKEQFEVDKIRVQREEEQIKSRMGTPVAMPSMPPMEMNEKLYNSVTSDPWGINLTPFSSTLSTRPRKPKFQAQLQPRKMESPLTALKHPPPPSEVAKSLFEDEVCVEVECVPKLVRERSEKTDATKHFIEREKHLVKKAEPKRWAMSTLDFEDITNKERHPPTVVRQLGPPPVPRTPPPSMHENENTEDECGFNVACSKSTVSSVNVNVNVNKNSSPFKGMSDMGEEGPPAGEGQQRQPWGCSTLSFTQSRKESLEEQMRALQEQLESTKKLETHTLNFQEVCKYSMRSITHHSLWRRADTATDC